jgi:hypothetical protein
MQFPGIIDADDFDSKPLERPMEIIPGLLFKGFKMSLGGGSKTRKSWCLCDMSFCLGHSMNWFGFQCKQARVLYVNLEIHPYYLQERFKAIAKAHKTQIVKGRISVWNLRGHAEPYKPFLTKLRSLIKPGDYDVIIIDPIYKIMGAADENNATDMADMLNHIEAFAVYTGGAIVYASHFSKGNQAGKNHLDRVSGSGVSAARDPDVIMTMTERDDADTYAVEITVRNTEPLPAFTIDWSYPLMHKDGFADPSLLKGSKKGRRDAYSEEEFYELLTEQPLCHSEWKKKALDKMGMKEGSFNNYRKRLEDKGMITFKDGLYTQVVLIPAEFEFSSTSSTNL